jgi:pimeloyl-ACP methyl ester carboxylesterase
MGGLMAQEIGLTHPERVLSLSLVATHPGIAHGVFPQEVHDFLAARLGMSPEESREFSIPFNYHPDTPRALIEEDWAIRETGTAGPEGYVAQGGTATWTGWELLPQLSVPTLVVTGAEVRLVVPADSEKIAGAIPGARLVRIEGANHVLTTDRADEVNDLLLGWFSENEAEHER